MYFAKRDYKEEARIARRRQNEEERKKRIFDPRVRLMGVDLETWKRQLDEKRAFYENEQRINFEFDRQKRAEEKLTAQLDAELERKRKQLAKDLESFHILYQHPSSRREYDLNDPNYLKKMSTSDFGTKTMEGEDLNFQERTSKQKRQTASWLLQQMEEKKEAEEEQRRFDEEYARKFTSQTEMARRLAQLDEECRKKLDKATAEVNTLKAIEKHVNDSQEARKWADIEAQEIINWMTGSFLNGKKEDNTDNIKAVVETKRKQLEQIEEHRTQKVEAKATEEKWNEFEKGLHKEVYRRDLEFQRQQKTLDQHIGQINRCLAGEHFRREMVRNNIRDLVPAPEFFEQFNKSTY